MFAQLTEARDQVIDLDTHSGSEGPPTKSQKRGEASTPFPPRGEGLGEIELEENPLGHSLGLD